MILRDLFFYLILTQIKDSFSCSLLSMAFVYLKEVFQKFLRYTVMRHNIMTSLKHNNAVTCLPMCGCSFFILPKGWYGVCEIIRIYHDFEGRIEKSVPRIAVWHHKACRVITKGDPEEQIFLSYPHTNN